MTHYGYKYDYTRSVLSISLIHYLGHNNNNLSLHIKIFRFAKMFDLKQVGSCMVTASKTSVELLNKGMNCVAFRKNYNVVRLP
jgi:hypothetical protein